MCKVHCMFICCSLLKIKLVLTNMSSSNMKFELVVLINFNIILNIFISRHGKSDYVISRPRQYQKDIFIPKGPKTLDALKTSEYRNDVIQYKTTLKTIIYQVNCVVISIGTDYMSQFVYIWSLLIFHCQGKCF